MRQNPGLRREQERPPLGNRDAGRFVLYSRMRSIWRCFPASVTQPRRFICAPVGLRAAVGFSSGARYHRGGGAARTRPSTIWDELGDEYGELGTGSTGNLALVAAPEGAPIGSDRRPAILAAPAVAIPRFAPDHRERLERRRARLMGVWLPFRSIFFHLFYTWPGGPAVPARLLISSRATYSGAVPLSTSPATHCSRHRMFAQTMRSRARAS